MGNQDEIREFARMLDLLAMGRNVASKDDLDPVMARIACALAATDLSGLSRNREALRQRLVHHQSSRRLASMESSTKRGFSMLAAFSMGFATVIVLAYISLAIILPLTQRTGREPSLAGVSTGEATHNALLAAIQRLESPTATLSPTPATPEASPTALPTWTSTPRPANTEAPVAPSPTPTWTPIPLSPVTPTPTWTLGAPSAWAPPTQVDFIVTVEGYVGTVYQFGSSLPSEDGAASHTIQIIVNIPPAEGNAGRRRVDYAVTCTGTGTDNLRWGWWGWPPAGFVCGSIVTSDGLLWSQNVTYFVIEAPGDDVTSVTYTLTVTVGEYNG